MSSKSNIVLYEIYPQSFKDANGDGMGDLQGIISKLDYLVDLGVNALWLTPFYPSPMKDCGYDIADFCAIAPEFGNMDDFSALIAKAHEKKIKIVIDLVLNHTSDEHPWFQESRASRDNPKRDWYIWHDPVNGGVPNNWKSTFDPSAWEFDASTGQYYFHSFLKEQPDLNWLNPQVRQTMKDVCKFWIDQGIDGFRLDSVNYLAKDQRFLDEPINPDYDPTQQPPFYALKHTYMKDQDGIFALINEVGDYVQSLGSSFFITEAYPHDRGVAAIPEYQKYYRSTNSNFCIPFNFELLTLPWDASSYSEFVTKYLAAMQPEDIPVFEIGNHDRSRVASRLDPNRAKVSAVLLLTLPGMPVIYYGEELGMQDVRPIPKEMIHDTKEYRSPGFGRDPFRTPMQWDDTNFAGFSTASPWLPLEKEFTQRNVATEQKDPQSMFHLYQSLLAMRSETDSVLIHGDYKVWETGNSDVFAYTRTVSDKTSLILLNFSDKPQQCKIPFKTAIVKIRSSSDSVVNESEAFCFDLQPNEGCVLEG